MNLYKLHNKQYVNLFDLLSLGFPYPKKGTSILYVRSVGHFIADTTFLRFYEKKKGWDGIFISPFANELAKLNVEPSEVYLEFNPENFIAQYAKD